MAKRSLCNHCNIHEAVKSGILHDVYYKAVCELCLAGVAQVSSGDARWRRSIDAEDNEFNIMQPYNADGTVNAGFAKAYPQQTKALFSDDEIIKALRA